MSLHHTPTASKESGIPPQSGADAARFPEGTLDSSQIRDLTRSTRFPTICVLFCEATV